jgi:uncharacterized membrane protein YphA (DoxX/SURF4 family)
LLSHSAGLGGTVAVALLALRFMLAGLFIRAGIVKLADITDFRLAVGNYQIVPVNLVKAAAVGVPLVEVAAGGLLMLGIFSGVVCFLLAALLAGFTAVIAVNLARGRVFDCGCGGTAPRKISWRHVISNMLLAAFAVAIALAPPSALTIFPGPGGMFSVNIPPGAGVPAVLATALGLVMAIVLSAAMAARSLLQRLQSQADSFR